MTPERGGVTGHCNHCDDVMMASDDDDVTLRAQLTLVPHWLAPASVLASTGSPAGPGRPHEPGPSSGGWHWTLERREGGRCHRGQTSVTVTISSSSYLSRDQGSDYRPQSLVPLKCQHHVQRTWSSWQTSWVTRSPCNDRTLSLWWRSPDTHLSSLCHNPTLGCQQEQTRKRFPPTLADWIIPCLQLLLGSEVRCAPLKLTSCRKSKFRNYT